MKKGIIIGIIVVIVIGAGGYITYKHMDKKDTVVNSVAPISSVPAVSEAGIKSVIKPVNTQVLKSTKVQFSKEATANYYKLSQAVGDIGLPSSALTVNLDSYKTINGVNYYKAYSYNTRAAYNNDNSSVKDGNYSHMANEKAISLDGKSISLSEFGQIDYSKMSSQDKYNAIYKIAAMYVEGYTANNPKLVVSANDNYEGDLNAEPQMTVDLTNVKNVDSKELYNVTISVNGYKTSIYVGLDGYVFVGSQKEYYQLFFPNKLR